MLQSAMLIPFSWLSIARLSRIFSSAHYGSDDTRTDGLYRDCRRAPASLESMIRYGKLNYCSRLLLWKFMHITSQCVVISPSRMEVIQKYGCAPTQ
jgi:hypothetical protein